MCIRSKVLYTKYIKAYTYTLKHTAIQIKLRNRSAPAVNC